MFNESKYTKWYYNIVENAKKRPIKGYVERHHIIPKCLGGHNKKDNIVPLTAKEHFIVHHLLCYMCENVGHTKKMQNAIGMFMQKNKQQSRNLTARQYAVCRNMLSNALKGRTFSEETKEKLRAKRATQDMSYRIGTKHSEETKEKIRAKRATQVFSEESHEKKRRTLIKRTEEGLNPFSKPWKELVGDKYSDLCNARSERVLGENNPMSKKAGTFIFINNGVTVKHHPKHEPLPDNWTIGRKVCLSKPSGCV